MDGERLRKEFIRVGEAFDTPRARGWSVPPSRCAGRGGSSRGSEAKCRGSETMTRGTRGQATSSPLPSLSSPPSLASFSAQRIDMAGHFRLRCYFKLTLWTLPFGFKHTHLKRGNLKRCSPLPYEYCHELEREQEARAVTRAKAEGSCRPASLKQVGSSRK